MAYKTEYDYVSGWEGSFTSMAKEGWLETVTDKDVPNLADIPKKIIVKDTEGNWKAIPRAIGGIYFGYRSDISPIEITSIDNLLDPKLNGRICWPGPTQNMLSRSSRSRSTQGEASTTSSPAGSL